MVETPLKIDRFKSIRELLRNNSSLLIEGLWDSPKALIGSLALQATGKNVLILTGESREERRLYLDFPNFCAGRVFDFPAWETLPDEKIPPSPDIVGERYKILHTLQTSKEPQIVIAKISAALQKLITPDTFKSLFLKLYPSQVITYEKVIEKLIAMGYQRAPVASDKGEFAVRGGIIDLFPVSSTDPYRIEFWGDLIESIRFFDPVGQKSVGELNDKEVVEITPAREMELLPDQKELATLLDYLGPDTIVVFDELVAIEDRWASLKGMIGSFPLTYCTFEEFYAATSSLQKIYLCESSIESLSEVEGGVGPLASTSFEMFGEKIEANRWIHPFQELSSFLTDEPGEVVLKGEEMLELLPSLPSDYTVQFLFSNKVEEKNLRALIEKSKIQISAEVVFKQNYLSKGFVFPEGKLLLLPYTEISQRYKIRRQKQRSTYHNTSSDHLQLTPGDYVVHVNNGIGKFLGIERRPNHQQIETEYFLIEYGGNSKLFVPIDQAHLISKYIGSGESTPQLHTIGSGKWSRTKSRVKKAIVDYASDLLKIYSEREVAGGYQYPADSADIEIFDNSFPFIETEDQAAAIRNVKEDLLSPKSMDRLVCGDVGYGKTEVAMRAAFKAVVDGGKQVAVLVPTTVLAMQHYETFCERMREFPVTVDVVSRFRKPKEIRKTLERTAEGKVDILIGTHRVTSKDVLFKNLGLVIIDEEQRFGVRAKEHLKKLKAGVDCLTLSATPIPRTLYMSLVGVRDLSVIATPPEDRLPIKTVIIEDHLDVIKKALVRELARDGQAYVIHNRVETIYGFAEKIQRLVPDARIVVGHGQMSADEMDSIFHQFKNGEADILVATTIVESGIDIPNANTMIIDRADRFGLADLYQLRGRVGRWIRRAYAYFLVPKNRIETELVQKRLGALADLSGYGGGMKIAMRDLEIRGAGDILGLKQSGSVSSIGFHLYCKLLNQSIQTLQGNLPNIVTDVQFEFDINARLPEDYINETTLRIEMYQRFGEAVTLEALENSWNEMKDRYGRPPEEAYWLYHLCRIKVFASRHRITSIKISQIFLTAQRGEKESKEIQKIILKQWNQPKEFEEGVIRELKLAFKIKSGRAR